jgi:hypothetical protein
VQGLEELRDETLYIQKLYVGSDVGEVRLFKSIVNNVRLSWSLVANVVDMHRLESDVSSHIQRNVLENQHTNEL